MLATPDIILLDVILPAGVGVIPNHEGAPDVLAYRWPVNILDVERCTFHLSAVPFTHKPTTGRRLLPDTVRNALAADAAYRRNYDGDVGVTRQIQHRKVECERTASNWLRLTTINAEMLGRRPQAKPRLEPRWRGTDYRRSNVPASEEADQF